MKLSIILYTVIVFIQFCLFWNPIEATDQRQATQRQRFSHSHSNQRNSNQRGNNYYASQIPPQQQKGIKSSDFGQNRLYFSNHFT